MMKIYRMLSLTAVFLLMLASVALAQERVVTGTVTDENGGTMPGVNILVKGTSSGTATDAEGKFSISVPNDQATILVSFVGYATAEVIVGGRSVLNVQLTPDVQTLTELVVTGYAVQEKRDITGSVGLIKSEDLVAVPSANVENQLQGRVAGVSVVSSGQPGAGASVRIRGFSSFGGNNPLYVVDGVQTFDISTLNPNDIEGFTVLKDAGAASIYGSRASNGVIIITTKRGSRGGVKVNYNTYVGSQNPGKGFTNLLDTQGMADLQWLVYDNSPNDPLSTADDNITNSQYGNWVRGAGTSPTIPNYIVPAGANTVDESTYFLDTSNPSTANQIVRANKEGTDWYGAITRTAPIQNHDISLTGGNDKANFLASINYFNQQGIIKETFSKRYSIRLNSDYKIKDKVRIGESLQVTYRQNRDIPGGNLSEGNSISQVYRSQPIIPIYDIRGNFAGTRALNTGNSSNPYADIVRSKDNTSFDVRILGSIYAEVDLMKDLTFRTQVGGALQNGYYYSFSYPTYERSENVATSSFNEGAYYNANWNWTNTLSYNKTFGDNNIKVTAGYEALKTDISRGVSGTRGGYFSFDPNFWTLSNGATIINTNSNASTPTTLASSFARADYNLKDKYMVSATIRRDGSSKFQQQYGTFPSFTAAWRISNESFMSGVSAINDLKIRGGYGEMGSQVNLSVENQFYLYGGSAASSNYDINGAGTSSSQGFRPTRIGNPNAQWEVLKSTNIGFDLVALNNKLEVTFDWYQKVSDKLLFTPEVPGTGGSASAPAVNIASMKNTGIDLQLIYKQAINNDLKLDGNLTFTTFNNQITKIADNAKEFFDGGSRIGNFTINREGEALSSFFGYEVEGLWQTQAEIDAADDLDGDDETVFQSGAGLGRFKFKDLNGDNLITADDRKVIGSPIPDFTLGFNLRATYKNFDMTMFWYGSFGNDVFNYTKWWTDFWPSFQGAKSTDALNKSWTPERTNTTVPRAENVSNFSTNGSSSTYYIEDGSYFRLKNITVGYTFPKTLINRIGMENLRLYVQGVNLLTSTKYSGLDPELGGGDTARGIDYGNYPNVKQVLVGLNVGF